MSISEKIREYLGKHPEAGPTEVSNELAKKDIKASASLVTAVKKKLQGGKETGKRGPKPGSKRGPRAKVSVSSGLNIETIQSARTFAEAVGGVSAARTALAALSKLDAGTLLAAFDLIDAVQAPLPLAVSVSVPASDEPAPVAAPKGRKTAPRGSDEPAAS